MTFTLPNFVQKNIDLADKNTLALPARAAFFAPIKNLDQLRELTGKKIQSFILGGGSNCVFTGDFDGLIIAMQTEAIRLIREDSSHFFIEAEAGVNWHDFVCWTLQNNMPALENLSLIPGKVGACPIQNIGAYGLEVGEMIDSVETFHLTTGEIKNIPKEACQFAYRDSVFKQNNAHLKGENIITKVRFALPKKWTAKTNYKDVENELHAQQIETKNASAQNIADAVIAVRTRKLPDPKIIPNAGSFFQNPIILAAQFEALKATFPNIPAYPDQNGSVKLAAAWLIQEAGWKGQNLGCVGMYEKQALVLVNRGNATGKDVRDLSLAVQKDVLQKFNVQLHPEPIFFPTKND